MLGSKPEQRDQTTTPGTTFPTIYERCVGSLTSPANHYNTEDAGDGAYVFSLGEQGWRSGERARRPPTNVSRIRFPDPVSYLG